MQKRRYWGTPSRGEDSGGNNEQHLVGFCYFLTFGGSYRYFAGVFCCLENGISYNNARQDERAPGSHLYLMSMGSFWRSAGEINKSLDEVYGNMKICIEFL